jgi:hypothetical protein
MKSAIFCILFLSSQIVLANPLDVLFPKTKVPFSNGVKEMEKGNYKEALRLFQSAEQVYLIKKTKGDTKESLWIRASLSFLIGRNMGDSKSGDPCPFLSKAREEAVRAAKIMDDGSLNEAVVDISEYQNKFSCIITPIKNSAIQIDNTHLKWVGHYYMSGIHEVGSELKLLADGRYEWFISYGATDNIREGTWGVEKEKIFLTPKNKKQSSIFETMTLNIEGDTLIGFNGDGKLIGKFTRDAKSMPDSQ